MIPSRINLLLPGEQRHQGVVSRRFVWSVLGTLGAAALVLWVGLLTARRATTAAELRWERRKWSQSTNRYAQAQATLAQLNRLRAIDAELRSWTAAAFAAAPLLAELRTRTPGEMQFTRLTLTAELRPPEKAGAGPTVRPLRAQVSGRAHGEHAEELVVQWVSELQRLPPLAGARLVRIQRETLAAERGGEIIRSFEIEADAAPRELK